MNCYICNHQSVTTPAAGTCIDCNLFACGKPPVRPDGRFHGDRCGCGCGKFVCKIDMPNHARTHTSAPERCFPEFTLHTSASVLSAADSVRRFGKSPEIASVAVDDFVVGIRPGIRVIHDARHWSPIPFFDEEHVSNHRTFTINRDFLKYTDTLPKFASLAARAIATVHAFHHLGVIELELPPRQRRSLRAIIDRHSDRRGGFRLPLVRLPLSWIVQSLRERLPDSDLLYQLDPAPQFSAPTDVVRWLAEGAGAVGA